MTKRSLGGDRLNLPLTVRTFTIDMNVSVVLREKGTGKQEASGRCGMCGSDAVSQAPVF